MAKVSCLILPARFEGSQTRDPLCQTQRLDFGIRNTIESLIHRGKDGSKETRMMCMNLLVSLSFQNTQTALISIRARKSQQFFF